MSRRRACGRNGLAAVRGLPAAACDRRCHPAPARNWLGTPAAHAPGGGAPHDPWASQACGAAPPPGQGSTAEQARRRNRGTAAEGRRRGARSCAADARAHASALLVFPGAACRTLSKRIRNNGGRRAPHAAVSNTRVGRLSTPPPSARHGRLRARGRGCLCRMHPCRAAAGDGVAAARPGGGDRAQARARGVPRRVLAPRGPHARSKGGRRRGAAHAV